MTDLSTTCQQRIIQEALQQENEKAHYAKTAYGQMYDVDGTPMGEDALRAGTVAFIGAQGPSGYQINQVPAAGRSAMREVRFDVTSQLGGHRYICAGRCAVPPDLPVGDPNQSECVEHPTLYSWLRPDSRPRTPIRTVRGECCAKRRHFDCLGFVTWCLKHALGADFPNCLTHFSVRRYQEITERRNRNGSLLPGDLLFDSGLQHIGIVVSATEVAHSAGYRWGVRRTLINGPIYPASPGSLDEGTGQWGQWAGRLTQETLRRLRGRPR